MVHWVGPKKGLSRGYCFLEYEKKEVHACFFIILCMNNTDFGYYSKHWQRLMLYILK